MLLLERTTKAASIAGEGKPEKGFEPLAPRLQGACSDQLSYSGETVFMVDAESAKRAAVGDDAKHRVHGS